MHLDSSALNKEKKKLKNYNEEKLTLEKIVKYIKFCNDYKELKSNPFSKVYGFEELKYELSGYSSFRISKSGVIRLITKVDEDNNKVIIKFISMEHYEDFKRKLKRGNR